MALKNSAPFFCCILKINSQLVEDAQDLDIVMPLYNLLYYSKNYRKTIESFWNYYRDEPISGYNNDNNERTRIFYPIKDSESFNYKTKLVGELPDDEDDLENIKIAVPLKHLSKFILNLDMLLINCEIELILKWSESCVLTSKATRGAKPARPARADPAAQPALEAVDAINAPPDLKFNITDCKLYVPVVTLQAEYENKSYEQLKTGSPITATWSK